MEFEYLRKLDRIDGKAEGKREAFASLVEDGTLTLSEAAIRSGLSEEELKSYMNKDDKLEAI